jgi:Phospholipase_D-nuclease N-terminal
MSKSGKLLVGILSLLPLILIAAYLITFFSFFLTIIRYAHHEEMLQQLIFARIGWIIGIALLMGITSLGLLIYFIIHVVSNKVIDSTERIVWVLIFIFAGLVGFPIYWYMRIWKELPAKQSV